LCTGPFQHDHLLCILFFFFFAFILSLIHSLASEMVFIAPTHRMGGAEEMSAHSRDEEWCWILNRLDLGDWIQQINKYFVRPSALWGNSFLYWPEEMDVKASI
jgi:hypothetical protein